MIIAFACDHGGFSFREDIISFLQKKWHTVLDLWPQKIDSFDDFPDYSSQVCDTLLSQKAERGVLVCGTGIGMSIAANRFRWVRAAVVYNSEIAKICRSHNDANVACFWARTMNIVEVLSSLDVFLSEPFIGDKYQRRNDKIDNFC